MKARDRRRRRRARRGVVLAESAIVYLVALLLILGTIVLGLGVSRYGQLAALARNGARWASVHGPTYQSENSASAPTSADVMNNAIAPQAFLLDLSKLTIDPAVYTKNAGCATVTLTYQWIPEMTLPGLTFTPVISFTSTSVMPITY